MTRAQYEAKYGKPVSASPVATSTPPVQMTRAQYEEKYGPAPTAAPPKQGLFARITAGVDESSKQRAETLNAISDAKTRGEQGTARSIFQTGGQIVGAAVDPVTETIKQVTPAPVKKSIMSLLKPLGTGINVAADVISDIPAVQKFAQTPASASLERDIQAGNEFMNLLPGPKGAAAVTKATAVTADAAVTGAKKVATSAVSATVKGTEKGVTKAASVASGVPQDVLERAASPERAAMTERAIKHVLENEKEPYLDVATRAASSITAQQEKAAGMLSAAKQDFRDQFPDAAFDVRPKIPAIAAALDGFRSSGLIVQKSGRGYVIGRTAQSSFTPQEVTKLNELFTKMNTAKAVNVDDLLALRQSLSTAYDAIPLGVNKTPRPYHAAVMSLKAAAEPAIQDLLPDNLRKAFDEYAILQEMKDDIGNKLINGDGTLKDGAEQFLSNMVNTNKGNVRMNAQRFREITGLDLESEVQAIKDAQKLAPMFPTTGSRTQDVIRALMVSGLGTFAGGPVGSIAAIAATSPRVMGKAAVARGKFLAKKAQSRSEELSSPAETLTPNSLQSATKSNASMKETVAQKPVLGIEPGPRVTPDAEPFQSLLKNPQLQQTIDRHILQAEIQIGTAGRQAMRKKGAFGQVLETTKTNLEKALRDANMPTFADAVAKFDVKPYSTLLDFKEALMTYLKELQPGLSMKNVGRVHPEDKQVMIDFIDAVRTGKVGGDELTPAQRLAFETEARAAAPGYGINPDLAPGKLADKFDQFLSRSSEKKGKPLGEYLARKK